MENERRREVRIKRANTDWWINEKAIVGMNGLTYIAYITDMGELHIKEFDAKCSKNLSRDVTVCRLNSDYCDEHNAPSICILEDGRIIVAYTGHASNNAIRYRITEHPYDIMSFGQEMIINYDGSVTYVQLFENTKKGEIWLFCRVNKVNWEFRYSQNGAKSFSSGNTFLHSDAGGLFYLNVRKQNIITAGGEDEQWFFSLYGHPQKSADHRIRAGIFKSDGALINPSGESLDLNLYNVGGKMDLDRLSTVYDSREGTTVRLLDVSATVPPRVGFCSFVLDRKETCVYYSAEYIDGAWIISKPIAKAGSFLSDKQTDGSQTYVPGMAYYYGVGEAGIFHRHGGTINTNRIYIARKSETSWLLESYVSTDCGKSYELEKTVRELPLSSEKNEVKIWRPIVPVYAQDNLPVYWHEGVYTAHTGGWHSDAVMYVEYDD